MEFLEIILAILKNLLKFFVIRKRKNIKNPCKKIKGEFQIRPLKYF